MGVAACAVLIFATTNANELMTLSSRKPQLQLMQEYSRIADLIILAAGYFPGYYATVFLVEILGRRTIQLIGFAMTSLFLGIAGGDFSSLTSKAAPFFIVFVLLQVCVCCHDAAALTNILVLHMQGQKEAV